MLACFLVGYVYQSFDSDTFDELLGTMNRKNEEDLDTSDHR
jgi:hypothetical protein